ncbi:MATE family efflux transporter [Eubacterium sp. MSJ-13]|uniref:MATE family efflux transporter n=1 Tax=Eubacterium sp. MSJ-13 TaxID=2841513 RepID=UPI001C10A224|nr:MATE family efflux transporter [Eubacterium sp. MSJ-13]MBU5477876.1 MATE family efflux transporter [Eubacterium sp. MSJ-13]
MDLLKDNLKKLYFRFLIPSLGSAMVMSIYTLTDAIVIGKGVGSDALAALSITTPLLCILMATGILFGVGGSVQMSVHRGTGNQKKANRFFTLSFITLAVIALALWFIYGFGISTLLRLMGANDTLYPYAMAYMKYINIFLPVAVFSNYMAIFVRADNNPNRAMAGVLLGGVVNIVLDIVFVFPLQMGIGGAALASTIGMVIQVVVGISHFFSNKNNLRFIKPKHIFSSIWQIIGNGIPSFFNEFANGFIVLLFNIQILKYCGDSALSVYSVISNCVILFNSLFTGVGQSIQPIIATNYGAGRWERIKKVKGMAFVTIIIMGAVFSACGILFPEKVCTVFMDLNKEMRDIAGLGVRVYFITFLPMGINLLTSYYLQSVLSVKESLCISLLRNVILSSIAIITFPLFFGKNSLWMVMPVVELCVLLLSMIFLRKSGTKNNVN